MMKNKLEKLRLYNRFTREILRVTLSLGIKRHTFDLKVKVTLLILPLRNFAFFIIGEIAKANIIPEFIVVEETPFRVITMPIKTDGYDPDSAKPSGLYVLLRVAHTEKYPDEVPELDFDESDNMSPENLSELRTFLNEKVRIYPIFIKMIFKITC
jgi:hypothetical protein